MKKALIPALLVAFAAFAPCLRNVVECRDPVSDIACATGSSLFWRLWDELLIRELAEWAQTASADAGQLGMAAGVSQR
jgi:cytochrome c biogenesis protein ResB